MSKQLSLKNKTINGLLWSSFDKFAVLIIGFIIGLILARKLSPSDYGLVGMLSIFLALSHLFIESGFSSALIQKHTPSEEDYATIFYFNLLTSILLYLILFFLAPLIASFFKTPQLILLTRVLSIVIIINSLSIVQLTKFTISLDFRTQTVVSLISVILSGCLGLIAAYRSYGVWSLVIQQVSASMIKTSLLFFYNKYLPPLIFSIQSFKKLFGFSSNLLAAGLSSTIINNIYSVFIGKNFNSKELGYYTNSKLYPEYLESPIGNVFTSVGYPVLSSLKNEKSTMVEVYRRLLRVTAFFALPVLTLFAILSESFIHFILTEKWMPMVPLIQWMCFARLLAPLCSMNMLTLNVLGKSNLFLKIELLKLPITIIALVITIPLGLKAIVIGHFITMLISFFLTTYFPGKFFGYGPFRQLKDMLTVIIATIFMAIAVICVNHFLTSDFLKLLIGGITGVLVFSLAAYVMKIEEINDLKELSNSLLFKKNQD